MNIIWQPYIPGRLPAGPSLPMARFLPPSAQGIFNTWLKENVQPGGWVLDLFGSTPALALEAARAGYRVIVASNNPILTFTTHLLAQAPRTADFQSALAELATLRRGSMRLDVHLQSMYLTECASCSRQIQADTYLWRRDEKQPYARIYSCPYCHDEGEREITDSDLKRLEQAGPDGLHRSRAMQRVDIGDAQVRLGAEEALKMYAVRPLDFIFTLLNKLEGLAPSNPHRRMLLALALSACEEGCSLWAPAGGRIRPRLLTRPADFREDNLWRVMENAVQNWAQPGDGVPCLYWPQLPPQSGGISIYRGRLKNLLPLPENITLQAGLTIIPRPSQAFWTLSAMWAGWIWGHEAVEPLKGALQRRRYDWSWQAHALLNAFSRFVRQLPPDLPLFATLPEINPGFLTAAVTAGDAAGLRLEGMALREEDETAQITWRTTLTRKERQKAPYERICAQAISDHLLERNEPSSHTRLFFSGMAALSREAALPTEPGEMKDDLSAEIQAGFSKALTGRGFLVRYQSTAQSTVSGLWWLAEGPIQKEYSLSDRIELAVLDILQKRSFIVFEELDQLLCSRFPGLLTPGMELLNVILESYAEKDGLVPGQWKLPEHESVSARQADIHQMRDILHLLADKFNLQVVENEHLEWCTQPGEPLYRLYILTTSIISRKVFDPALTPEQGIFLLPGGRCNLLNYKLQKDLHLADAVAGWHYLKFRHLRKLASRPDISLPLFQAMLDSDPPRWDESQQMSILEN